VGADADCQPNHERYAGWGLPPSGGRGKPAPPFQTKYLHYVIGCCIICIMSRYAKNAGAIFSVKIHLVWCPKYRRPVLQEEIATRFEQLLRQKAKELDLIIHALDIMPDHVHLFVEHEPIRCVAEIVNRLKGYTSRVLRQEFPSLRSRLPTLWSRSYFAASVGSVTASAIRKYIESQKGK